MNTNLFFKSLLFCFLMSVIGKFQMVNAQFYNDLPKDFQKLWFATDTTAYWVLGIKERFVAMDNAFWKIDSVTTSGKSYILHLSNTQKTRQINLTKLGKNKISLLADNQPPRILISNPKKPNYSISEKAKPAKSAAKGYIQGYIVNFNPSMSRNLATGNIINMIDVSEKLVPEIVLHVNNQGQFSFNFDLNFNEPIVLMYNLTQYQIIAKPGDSILVALEIPVKDKTTGKFSPEHVYYMGDNWQLNSDNERYREFLNEKSYSNREVWNRLVLMSPENLQKQLTDTVMRHRKDYAGFLAKNKVTETFKVIKSAELDNDYQNVAIDYAANKMFKKEPIPDDFLSCFRKGASFNKYNFIPRNLNFILLNIDSYIRRKRLILSGKDAFYSDSVSFSEIASEIPLKAENLADSIKIKLAELQKTEFKNLTSADSFTLNSLRRNFAGILDEYTSYKQISSWLRILENEFNGCYYDLMIAERFYWFLSNKLYNEANLHCQLGFDKIKNEFVRQLLTNELEAIKKLNSANLNFAQIVQDEFKGGEEVLKDIVERHKNKVIYVDFWATWCGPCMQEMASSRKIKETFKDEDVVFVYVCTRSQVANWKPVIANMNISGTHYFLTDTQADYFKKHFQVSAVPHYLLIDKEGKIFSDNAVWPSSEKIETILSGLLAH
jgi:thiol-disulfide isomerase/thioredoxin